MAEERTSAERRLKEAQNLAISVELLAFCEAQRAFIDSGTGEDGLHTCGRQLAREARRRRIEPQSLLLAMRIGGCYRSDDFDPNAGERLSRYFAALSSLLTSYYGAESRPAERRMTPRPKRPSSTALEDRTADESGPPDGAERRW